MFAHSQARLDHKYIEFVKILHVYLNHFPKHEKYALTNRILNLTYKIYELITEGRKRYHKKTTLTELNISHEQLRMLIRLSYELGYFSFKDGKITNKDPQEQALHRLIVLQTLIDELGRMIGGWIVYETEQVKG